MRVVGVDLSTVEEKGSGFCFIDDHVVLTMTLFQDDELIAEIDKISPEIVAIDAPLTRGEKFRKAELEMRREGYRLFPLSMPSMKKLTERGIRLKRQIRYPVMECHPTSTAKTLQIIRKPVKVFVQVCEERFLLKFKNIPKNPHEVDAVLAALTARLYLLGKCRIYGNENEGQIILPKPSAKQCF